MILQALYNLAQREKLVEDQDYETKQVRWIVRIGEGGKFLGIQCTDQEVPQPGKRKSKMVPKTFSLPRGTARTSGDKAFFFCDKPDYVFGVNVGKDKPWPAEKLASRFGLFREKVADCAKATSDPAVVAVSLFLESIADGAPPPELSADAGPGDIFAFRYNSDELLVSSREAVRRFWHAQRNPLTVTVTEKRLTCLVSGAAFAETGLFPQTKNAPGIAGDTSLISFNSPAFESYGWKSNQNAPVSREAGVAVATGLNRLLHPNYPNPANPDESLPRRNLRITDDTAVCYWSSKTSDSFTDFLADLLGANVDAVPELYRSIWRGKQPPSSDTAAFYALVITGQKGRAVLRDWFETTLREAQANIAQHFNDLRIVRNAPWKKGEEAPPAIPLNTLLESIATQGKLENVPASLAAQMMRAALTGTLYPFALLTCAVERARAEAGQSDWLDLQRRDARAAVIKAVLNRRNRLQQSPNYKEVMEEMDPSNTNPGYVLGALMAILERLQQEALQGVNASVVDKYFSGASAAPRATFDRLVKNARHHAKKAGDGKNPGLVLRLEKLIDELLSRINVDHKVADKTHVPIGFPLTLPIEQQGLFVIGYHHMRHFLWLDAERRAAWEATYPEAAPAFLWARKNAAVGISTPLHSLGK